MCLHHQHRQPSLQGHYYLRLKRHRRHLNRCLIACFRYRLRCLALLYLPRLFRLLNHYRHRPTHQRLARHLVVKHHHHHQQK
jgi:hypothetical protein